MASIHKRGNPADSVPFRARRHRRPIRPHAGRLMHRLTIPIDAGAPMPHI
jgi:hypothetical protein